MPSLTFAVQPGGANEGAAITPAVRIAFLDGAGNPMPGATGSVTVRIASNPAGGTLSGTTTVAVANGAATFSDLSIDKPGRGYSLRATAAGFADAFSAGFDMWCRCWSSKAPMPAPRYHVGVGAVNGVLYTVGGFYAGELATLEGYDADRNSWTTKASMPTPRTDVAAGVVNGVLYAVGGDTPPGPFSADIGVKTQEAYDPVANSWTTRAPMQHARTGLAVGVVNGVLYAVGGYSFGCFWGCSGGVLTDLEAYDPVADRWTTLAPMPTRRTQLAVGVVNGILYAVGGANGSSTLPTVEAYDPATNAWTTRAPMPTARSGLAVGVVHGVLYAVGGYSAGYLTTVEAYDPVANSWTTKTPMPTPSYGLGVGVVNGVLYAIGGYNNNGKVLAAVEAYDPARDY